MEIIMQFTLWMMMMVMVASNSNRIHLICEEINIMSEKLDNMIKTLESINNKLDKEGR